MLNAELAVEPVHISPLQGNGFADAKAEADPLQSHRAEWFAKVNDEPG
jgi:hypothetical protein